MSIIDVKFVSGSDDAMAEAMADMAAGYHSLQDFEHALCSSAAFRRRFVIYLAEPDPFDPNQSDDAVYQEHLRLASAIWEFENSEGLKSRTPKMARVIAYFNAVILDMRGQDLGTFFEYVCDAQENLLVHQLLRRSLDKATPELLKLETAEFKMGLSRYRKGENHFDERERPHLKRPRRLPPGPIPG